MRGSQQLYHRCRHGRSHVSIFITLWKNEAILSRADKNPASIAVNPPTLSEKMFLWIIDISSSHFRGKCDLHRFSLIVSPSMLKKVKFFCVCVCLLLVLRRTLPRTGSAQKHLLIVNEDRVVT